MTDIMTLLSCFEQCIDKTTVRQMSGVIVALLTMTGQVTMRGLARWSEQGGSYRTVQRWFNTTLPCASLSWLFIQQHVLHAGHEYLIAGSTARIRC